MVLNSCSWRRIIDVDIRKSIHRMFKWILKLVVVWVPLDDPDVAWLLRQMFNRTQKLFLVGAESARTYSLSNYGVCADDDNDDDNGNDDGGGGGGRSCGRGVCCVCRGTRVGIDMGITNSRGR